MTNKTIDICEQEIILNYPKIMNVLLKDRTTKKNIIWATDDYEELGEFYKAENEITIDSILANDCKIIQPRITKSLQNQLNRTKGKAEVFTPSWICNAQNNLVDKDWFDDARSFNRETYKSWETNLKKIMFKNRGTNTWQKYIDAFRMEITCGEAPYLVSRYDTVNGHSIPLLERIGLLDRKLRIVNENTNDEDELFKWSIRAYQSIYGFELQGDSLLLARENLLYTFMDNLDYKFKRKPNEKELLKIANIISWNIWQMDGLKFTVPYSSINAIRINQQLSLFQEEIHEAGYCVIKDWKAVRLNKKSIIEYRSLIDKEE